MSDTLNDRTAGAGNVLSFAAFADSRKRRLIAYDEPRGQVLLFTGVRYDRLAGGDPGAPTLSNGSRPGRRRRRG